MTEDLRLMTRARLRAGDLPHEPALFTVAIVLTNGRHPCAVCNDLIPGGILEFRLRFANEAVLHFHSLCHDAWLLERAVMDRE